MSFTLVGNAARVKLLGPSGARAEWSREELKDPDRYQTLSFIGNRGLFHPGWVACFHPGRVA